MAPRRRIPNRLPKLLRRLPPQPAARCDGQMYGIRKDLDLSFLQDLEVIQVRIGVYQVQFAFTDDVCIYAESNFRYSLNGEIMDWLPGATKVASTVVNLLG